MKKVQRRGFTLVEILVTTVVIAVLAAIVIPAMAKQVTAGDPARMASDLGNVKTGIEIFSNNIRPKFPRDIDDLVNPIDAVVDIGIDGASYSATQVSNWKGPYIEWSLTDQTVAASTAATAFRTANGYAVINGFDLCDGSQTAAGCSGSTGNRYVTIKVANVALGDFLRLNEVIDGPETVTSNTGLVRYDGTTTGNVFYLATPYQTP